MSENNYCDICCVDTDSVKGAYLVDGGITDELSFVCLYCYELISEYVKVKVGKMPNDKTARSALLIKRIDKYLYAYDAINALQLITQDWDNIDNKNEAIFRLYKLYLAGLNRHPKYIDSIWLIVWSISYNIGFPVKDAHFFPMNMNITTSANYLLFRRASKQRKTIKVRNGHMEVYKDDDIICDHCDIAVSVIKCPKCNAHYYCNDKCMLNEVNRHKRSCNEVREIDIALSKL